MPKEIYPVVLTRIEELTDSVRNFHFEFREKPRFDFIPGQFISVEVLKEGKPVKKSYSIASPPHFADRIELCIKKVEGGVASTWFFNLKTGDEINVIGPLGAFRLKEPLHKELIFASTGTGVAPFRAQILDLIQRGDRRPMTLLLGVRHENEILFEKEFRELEKQCSNFHFVPVISRPVDWQGERGYVQDILQKRFAAPEGREVYICGLVPMVNAVREALEKLGYAKEAVHFEKWT